MIFLARYWKVLAIVAAVGLVLVLYRHQIDSAYDRGYEAATAEMAERVAQANAQQAARDAQARKAFQANESRWIGERSALQNQITALAGRVSVRVCRPAASSGELSGAGAAASRAGGTGESRFHDVQAGPDIGAAITVFAGECESYRRRLKELQGRWPH